jgi:hypothetical protein
MKQGLVYGMFFLVLCSVSCERTATDWEARADNPEWLHQSMKQLTDIIVHDIFSPPVASRIYAYASIAAYEGAVNGYPEYRSLAGQARDLAPAPAPEEGKEYCFPAASLVAMTTVGKALIFSEEKMEAFQARLHREIKAIGMPKAVYERSVAYGEAIAEHILNWADKDMYKQTRTYPKYSISDDPSKWQPTPPDYMDGIEPHWNKIRPIALDSARQFTPSPPTPFSTDPNSQFMREVMEVYHALRVDDEKEKDERLAIAKHWDCNPYVSHHTGHVMYATKKITPGGHWMGITQLACQLDGADFMKSAAAYSLTSIALFDGFISCWDEKYHSSLARPETVINRYIDEDWLPALQTPPFPEHTSGHSVISRAAAIALTAFFGDDFAFEDTVEVEYGLPPRHFKSFLQASNEAALSRLYGGIHYRPAIDYGVAQGEKVGAQVLEKIHLMSQYGGK